MAYYDALIAKWATLAPGTTAQKLAAINALMVASPTAQRMLIPSYEIYNAVDGTEFSALSAANQQLVRDMLNMGTVDASPNKPARVRLLALFGAGTTTRTNLVALAAIYDTPPIPWATAPVEHGGGGLSSAVTSNDLSAAGGLS